MHCTRGCVRFTLSILSCEQYPAAAFVTRAVERDLAYSWKYVERRLMEVSGGTFVQYGFSFFLVQVGPVRGTGISRYSGIQYEFREDLIF